MFHRLLSNSRFWILISGIVLSILIAGLVQLFIPPGTLQVIRIEQIYSFASIIFLYMALLASPLTKVFPNLSFKEPYLHARRAIGVLAFYYAFLHACISFFGQLGGFPGIKYYNDRYGLALILGMFALAILFVMAVTSLDWAVDKLGFKNWKLLHRLVYLAGLAILLHIVLIGPHYANLNPVSILTWLAVAGLLLLEAVRFYRATKNQRRSKQKGDHETY